MLPGVRKNFCCISSTQQTAGLEFYLKDDLREKSLHSALSQSLAWVKNKTTGEYKKSILASFSFQFMSKYKYRIINLFY